MARDVYHHGRLLTPRLMPRSSAAYRANCRRKVAERAAIRRQGELGLPQRKARPILPSIVHQPANPSFRPGRGHWLGRRPKATVRLGRAWSVGWHGSADASMGGSGSSLPREPPSLSIGQATSDEFAAALALDTLLWGWAQPLCVMVRLPPNDLSQPVHDLRQSASLPSEGQRNGTRGIGSQTSAIQTAKRW